MSSMVPMKHLAPGSGDPEGRATRQEFVQRSGAQRCAAGEVGQGVDR